MVYVLVPCHNNKEDVLEVLACLGRQSYKDMRIVLVDDGSTDGTDASVAAAFPDAVVLKGDGTLWWTGANELGLQYILPKALPGDFVLLLNNDVIVDDSYVERLVQSSTENGRAIAGSALIDIRDPSCVEGGIRVDECLNLHVNRDRHRIEREPWDTNVDVLSGRGTLVPVEVFQDIGGFNRKRLPHYGADYEFAVRARRAGYKLVLSHIAKVHGKLDVTGLVAPQGKVLSWKECRDLLFSKKSKTNLFYYSNYVWLTSNKGDKVRNLAASARGILRSTVFATKYGRAIWLTVHAVSSAFVLLPKVTLRVCTKIYSFLAADYPFMPRDIAQLGFSTESLVHQGVLEEAEFLGCRLYRLRKGVPAKCQQLGDYSPDDLAKLYHLRQRAYSYRHKAYIDMTKIRILLGRRTASSCIEATADTSGPALGASGTQREKSEARES